VTQSVQRGGFSQGLRRKIGRRYFSGRLDFDARTIITKFQPINYNRE
jgi:hypothetical protein